MKPNLPPFVAVLLLAITQLVQGAPENATGYTLDQAFEHYFEAVRDRDIETVMTYVTHNEEIPFVMGDASMKFSREAYRDFHVGWFEDPNWNMRVEQMHQTQNGENAIIVAKTTYYPNPSNPETVYYQIVTIVYAREDNTWKIIADICTPANE
jgi:ketosteroid isomerase-like protein